MKKYTKTKLKLHPKEGMDMETEASPFIRICMGMAILLLSLGMFLLMATPFAGLFIK